MERPIRNSDSLILGLLMLVLASACSPASHATTLNSWLRNRDGIKKLDQKSYLGAYQNFLKAMEDDPLNPELHLNLGLAFEANEEYEKAEQAYRGALKLVPENSARRFEALFNLGGVLAKERKISEALDAYQAALDMQPDSKEVKTNIELLWQQGEGGGEGKDDKKDQQKKDQQKDGQGKNDQQNKDKDPQDEQKKQPKPFQSQELTPQDVKKILDEIKNQEQSIRAQEYERNAKDAPHGKDW